MNAVAQRVADGERLAGAMREVGGFPDVHLAMVEAGERGGFLDDVLAELGEFLEHQAERRATVIGNLIYPVILILVGLGIVVAALVFFVPQFESLFDGEELPPATRLLLGMSAVVINGWPYLFLLLLAAGGGWWMFRDRPQFQRRISLVQRRLPIVGDLVGSLAVARFTRTLGTLSSAGVPILTALSIVRDTLGNTVMMDAIDEVRERVTTGGSLATPLERCGHFPPLLVQIVNIGERSGRLEGMLLHAASAFDRQVNNSLKIFSKSLPPAMLVVMACVAAFVLAAILLPLLEMQQAVAGGR